MNVLKYIPVALLLFIASACNSDLEGVTFNEENLVVSSLSGIEANYELNVDESDVVVFTPKWSNTDFGYSAAATYTLQMDFAGKDFTNPVALTSSTLLTAEMTTLELNNAIRRLQDNYELVEGVDGEQALELRISATIAETISPAYSNVVQTAITPFSGEREYPSLAIRGDYSGWDFNQSQRIYSAKSDESYAAMVYFDGKSQQGWKICEDEAWTVSWGLANDHAYVPEASEVVLDGGDNIALYSKVSYFVEFNTTTQVMKMTKPHNSWGMVGSNNAWGDSGPDTLLALETEVAENGKVQHCLTVTLDLNANDEWKFRPDNMWVDDIGPGAVVGDFETNAGGNFTVTEAGNYTIKWYFNRVEPKVMVLKN